MHNSLPAGRSRRPDTRSGMYAGAATDSPSGRPRARIRLRHLGAASALGALGVLGACDAFDAPSGPDGATPTEALPTRQASPHHPSRTGGIGSERPPEVAAGTVPHDGQQARPAATPPVKQAPRSSGAMGSEEPPR